MSGNNNTNPNMEQSQPVKASVLTGIHNLQQTTRLLPPPESNELQIAIKATGICGSDLHYYHHFSIGDFPVLEPLTLGHESSGVVTAVGSSVPSSDFAVGDRVALEVGIPCGNCERCREGRYNICPSMRFRSSARSVPHFQGTLQEKINHPAEYCHKLPASVSLEEGALVEPLSVGIHAVRRSGIAEMPESKKACLVLGAGTIGLMVAAVLKVIGVKTIVIADVKEARVAFAVENGFADRGLLVSKEKGSTIEENLERAKKMAKAAGTQWHWGRGEEIGEFDMVFECTGVESSVQTAIYATRSGGKVLLVGIGAAVQRLPIAAAAQREVDLIGVFRYASTYKEGIEMIAVANEGGSLFGAVEGARSLPDVKKIITHRLQSVKEAFDLVSSSRGAGDDLVIKTLVSEGA